MPTTRSKLNFTNQSGHTLAGSLERPEQDPHATALFAHCFTCSKDIAAASRISKALAERGFAVLRFDFTGLGNSDGDFANTNFSSNTDDLVAAAQHLAREIAPPSLLIGHSLGGAAVLAAAERIPEARAVVTIGAPSSPNHVRHLFADSEAEIKNEGQAEVNLAGRRFTIKKQFIDDLENHQAEQKVARLGKALLICHSPQDQTVPIEEAARIYTHAKHPKSFLSLDNADHLVTRREDSVYLADVIAAWSSRYV